MKGFCGGPIRLERKTVEKNRRMHMKSLCFKLSSLIPKDKNSSKDAMTQVDNLDQAASYIKDLRERLERLKRLKEMGRSRNDEMNPDSGLPVIEVRHVDSSLAVILISGVKKRFMFYQVIRILEEEGANVVNASFSVVGDKIFHTIHSQAVCPRIGLDASRVSERLKDLVH